MRILPRNFSAKVEFFHRTVKDFLQHTHLPIVLKLQQLKGFDSAFLMDSAHVAAYRLLGDRHTCFIKASYKAVFRHLASYASIEMKEDYLPSVLESLLIETHRLSESLPGVRTESFLSYCARYSLWSFIQRQMELGLDSTQLNELLDPSTELEPDPGRRPKDPVPSMVQLETVRLLLATMCDPQTKHNNASVTTMARARHVSFMDFLSRESTRSPDRMPQEAKGIISCFIDSGAEESPVPVRSAPLPDLWQKELQAMKARCRWARLRRICGIRGSRDVKKQRDNRAQRTTSDE